MRMGLKGFAPDELEPRTSDGELVADLLANAGAQFESGSHRSHGSSSNRSASFGAPPGAGVALLGPCNFTTFLKCTFAAELRPELVSVSILGASRNVIQDLRAVTTSLAQLQQDLCLFCDCILLPLLAGMTLALCAGLATSTSRCCNFTQVQACRQQLLDHMHAM